MWLHLLKEEWYAFKNIPRRLSALPTAGFSPELVPTPPSWQKKHHTILHYSSVYVCVSWVGSIVWSIKSIHGHEVEGFQIVIAETWIPSSQTQNQTENLRPNKKHNIVGIQLVSTEASVWINSLRGTDRIWITFTDKKVAEQSLQICIVWLIIKPKWAAVMEEGCKLCWMTSA